MRLSIGLAFAIMMAASGCPSTGNEYRCDSDSQCVKGGATGRCVAANTAARYCAFPSSACPSGLVFDSTAGSLAGQCVAEVPDMTSFVDMLPPPDLAPECTRNEDCANGGMSPCGGTCDAGRCVYPGPSTDCGSSCTNGIETSKTCDGRGSCATAMLNCGVYKCGATKCKNSCTPATETEDCFNTTCSGTQCVACPADMVYIPPGPGAMGSASTSSTNPAATVTLTRGYCINKTEVTVAQFRACVNGGGCTAWTNPRNETDCTYAATGNDNLPMNCVTWAAANQYCAWSGLTGGARRLPTEAEWERAARSTDGRTYPWGEAANDCTYANMRNASNAVCTSTAPYVRSVGFYSPKGDAPSGMQDASGNVDEWALDCYAQNYGTVCNGSCTNPQAPGDPAAASCGATGGAPDVPIHAVRGQSYQSGGAIYLRRGSAYYSSYIGFRCAK